MNDLILNPMRIELIINYKMIWKKCAADIKRLEAIKEELENAAAVKVLVRSSQHGHNNETIYETLDLKAEVLADIAGKISDAKQKQIDAVKKLEDMARTIRDEVNNLEA